MRLQSRIIVVGLAVAASCAEKPAPQGAVNAAIDGTVFVTGPVAGVIVSAYALDLETGAQGALVGRSSPSDDLGAFHIDLGNHFGPTLLVARGVGGTYVEPATGVTVNWDSSTQLRAVYAEWTSNFDLDLELESGEQATAVISPWSEWAYAYSSARLQARRDRIYGEALKNALLRFRDHVEIDFWNVVPAVLSDEPVGAWNNNVQAGVASAALSSLTLRMARDSQISAAGLSSLQLVSAVRDDMTDMMAVLDGTSAQGVLKVGTCSTVCALSARTLRGHLSEAAAEFLGSTANKSGIRVTDAQQFLTRVSSRMSDLWPGGGDPTFDTQPPTITVTGIQEADILHGSVMATVKAFDAIEMGTVTLTLSRGGNPVTGFYTQNPSSPDAQTRLIALSIRTTELADGPLLLSVEATDKAGNRAQPVDLSLFLDNSPLGSVSGTVVVGGRVAGARVRAWEYAAATKGKMLGQATTDEEGVFKLDIMDTTAMVLLIEVDNMPAQAAATYLEGTSGWKVTFSSDDLLESLVTGWRNGDKRADGVITPWTTMATSLARGLYASPLYNSNATQWSAAVEDAFKLLEDHFFSDATRVSLRADQPAALTAEGTVTFNSQARYGFILAALGQLADQQAFMSNASPASMNTLTLTKLLAQDLGQDGRSSTPLFNGRTAAGQLTHGRVGLTSYETRVNLAVAAVDFMTNNPRYKAPFTQLDVAALIDRMSADGNARLYPASEPPLPFDTIKPDSVAFTSNTPPERTILRGDVVLEVSARDNRALGALSWTAPAASGAITGVRLDQTAGLAGPWLLSGILKSDVFPEGNLAVSAKAVDQAQNATTATRTFVVDRTPPVIAIGEATTATGAPIESGGWSGPTTVTVKGAITDAHLAAASYTLNGASSPLAIAGDGTWSVSIPMAATGTYSLTIHASDRAGNAALPAAAAFNCDATPPVVAVVPSTFIDDSNREAFIDGDGVGEVSFDRNGGTTVTLTSGTVATFRKYPTRYNATSEQLPEWRFTVSDNHSATTQVRFETRLTRSGAVGQATLLQDWSVIGETAAAAYNRAQRVSSATHPDVALISGTYTLEYRATDELGNATTIAAMEWTQEILPPPLRQRAAFDFAPCDPRIPTGHTLSNSGPCASLYYTASVNLNGTAGTLRIAKGYIDNPNTTAVQVVLQAAAPSVIRRGLIFRNVKTGEQNPTRECDGTGIKDQKSNGECFTPVADSPEFGMDEVLDRDLAVAVEVSGASFIGYHDASEVFEIPARSTATVYVLSDRWRFLMNGTSADYPSIGPLVNVTADLGIGWLRCIDIVRFEDVESCRRQAVMKEVTQLTRVAVRPNVTVTLTARPTGSPETTFRQATGVGVINGAYRNHAWETQAAGYPPF